MQEKRLNIGLLIDELDAVFTKEACKGAELGAIAIDANLYVFPGGYLDSRNATNFHAQFDYQYNTIFSFAKMNHLDVLYVVMGMIAGRVSEEEKCAFLEQFLGIPVVALYTKMDGYPSATFDNIGGFKQAIRHLIIDHGVERIGYVSGPKTNVDAMERMMAYRQVLDEEGILYREEYVTYGNFEESSQGVVRELVETHTELQAVVFANDRMAHGGYWAFEELGLKVGKDLLVVSFDNSDFASSLVPPLSTVEANAAELTYNAILNVSDVLQKGALKDFQISTRFVRRFSCGCQQPDYGGVSKFFGFENALDTNEHIQDGICKYLFDDYNETKDLQELKDIIVTLLRYLADMVKEDDYEKYEVLIRDLLSKLTINLLLHYTTVEKFFHVLGFWHTELNQRVHSMESKVVLTDIFANVYRTLALSNWQVFQSQQDGMDRMSQLINNMTSELLLSEKTDRISYERALSNLPILGVKRAYLYRFTKNIQHKADEKWVRPKNLLLKAYCNEVGAFAVPESGQLVRVENMFTNEFVQTHQRTTMVLSPLFSGEELYGLLLTEADYKNFKNITPIVSQLSAAMKTLSLLQKQREIQKKLEESLSKVKENNMKLDEISKSDELTGLYNRRGFLEYAHKAVVSKRNLGKKALIVYADMDNLKMINDRFGHDDGDFALKEIAAILSETFRSSDIVGRFGGDEFVVFASVGVENYEGLIKQRIDLITKQHNERCGKPYPIEMSTGVWEFECGPDVDLYEMLDFADEKLYIEKAEKKKARGTLR